MTETMCPRCDGEVSGVGPPKGVRRKRHEASPDRSTGYCMACHVALQMSGGVWQPSSSRPLP